MKILVYGSKGWIGNQFVNILKNSNTDFVEGIARVDNDTDLLEEINQHDPTHVISFIGRTHGKIDNKVYRGKILSLEMNYFC
jgi:1-deoxy-D-xylulose 5-phosphate reductoisomerase